ncbi:hypothetical protein OAP83_02810, partial [Rickettsiales bacterium]|nr:hypothetical protein [Rickettsiales bacterium]
TVDVDLNTVISPSVTFDFTEITFSGLVPGDSIDADVDVTLTGSGNRDFTCNINGVENSNTIDFFDGKFTISLSLDACEPTSAGNIQIISITSGAMPSTVSPSSSTTNTVTLSIVYDIDVITDYT